MLLPLISAAVLIALIGGLIFGIAQNRNDGPPTVPAVIQGSPSPESSPVGSDWGRFRGGVERTGYTSDPGPGGELNLQWSFTAGESLNGIMEADGAVIRFGAEGGLYALDIRTGAEQLWAIDLVKGQFGNAGWVPLPAIVDGVVFASTPDGVLVAIDEASGEVLRQQRFSTVALSAPTVADGHIYVAVDGKTIRSLDAATGEQEWSWDVPGGVTSQYPTIAEGKLFISDDATSMHAVTISTGQTVWSTPPIQAHRLSAYRDGKLFAPGADGRVIALDAATGSVLWETDPGSTQALNLISTESAIIVGTEADRVRALDPETGAEIWSILTPTLSNSPHASGMSLYVEVDEGVFAAIDIATGKEIGRTDAASGAGSTLAITGDLLVISGRSGPVRVFGPSVPATALAVAATSPVPIDIATPAPATGTSGAVVAAPASGDLEATHQLTLSFPPYPIIAQIQKGPDGAIWVLFVDGTLNIYDRDGNLLSTRTYPIGSGPGEFSWDVHTPPPFESWLTGASFAWLSDGKVYVTDGNNARIQILDSTGKVTGSWGEKGDADGQFQIPVWITLTPDNEIVVADVGRHDIQWFDMQGNFLRKLTGYADGVSFGNAFKILYDVDGNFWVDDLWYSRVAKFDEHGNELFALGGVASGLPGALSNPADFDLDADGNIWIADQGNHRVQVFDRNGNLLGMFNGCNTEAGCFRDTNWVLDGGNGFLYIGDLDLNLIQDWHLTKFRIDAMPDVPMMAAATPAAPVLATPAASPVAG